MEPVKAVITGPVGAGKTAFARALLGEKALTTEAPSSTDIGKPTTTVAMDFGTLEVGPYAVHLFGTPGQDRFDFMWEVLMEGALGFLLLLGAHRPEHLPESRKILDFVLSRYQVPYLVGITHLDAERAWDLEDIALYLRVPEERVFPLDARDAGRARALLLRLLEIASQGG